MKGMILRISFKHSIDSLKEILETEHFESYIRDLEEEITEIDKGLDMIEIYFSDKSILRETLSHKDLKEFSKEFEEEIMSITVIFLPPFDWGAEE